MATPQQVACSAKSHPGTCDKSSDISIHFGVSYEEKAALKNREKHILRTLSNMGFNVEKSPVVSVLVSGGGLRAAIACQGVLSELSHLKLLDLITYLAGVSGSTWCMSSLYTKSDSWQDMGKAENEFRRRLCKDSWRLSVALDGLCMAAERDDYSLTDFWSYSCVYYFTKELLDTRLSSVKPYSDAGTVPYPIFATIDHFLKLDGKENLLNAWFEFTPDWAGYSFANLKAGAYVPTTHYGSKYERGKLIQQEDERDFSYLRALCGSALADRDMIHKTIKDFLLKLIGFNSHEERLVSNPEGAVWKTMIEELLDVVYTFQTDGDYLPTLRKLQSRMTATGNIYFSKPEMLTRQLIKHSHQSSRDQQRQLIEDLLESTLTQELMGKSFIPSFLKFLKKTFKCLLFWTWGTTNNFLYKYVDIKDKTLTDREIMYLMDAGLAINSAFPLVLSRNTDIILSFDFSEGDPFETIKATKKYCEAFNIPFPPVDEARFDQEAEAPSDCYIFEGEKTPVVFHFPLFNKVNCSSTDIINEKREKYKTFNLENYSEAEVNQLLEDSKANVRNNKDRIMDRIQSKAVL